jgi:glycosyltransferase involved in cell wall biosynthesis
MKILLAHNYYGSAAPSGENTVFEAEAALLRSAGHEVIEFTRHSDEIRTQGNWGVIKGALSAPWNPWSAAAVRRLVERERPEVLHVHNTFPLISPAIFRAVKDLPVATVMTLHNYRTVCAAGIPMRDGHVCTECLDRRSVFPALRYGCYRESRLATLPLALMIALHRSLGSWSRDVDALIALTEFQKEELIRAGLPGQRLHVKPQFYPDPPLPIPWPQREEKILYIGRLGEEKGVRFLLEAWRQWGEQAPALELIGDGPLRYELENSSQRMGDKVRFLGQLPFAETQLRLANARLMIVPSVCFEGFPMVIREAIALGVPVAASNLGSMANLVETGRTGVLFAPGNPGDLLEKVRRIWGNPTLLETMGEAARAEFQEKYTAAANLRMLDEIYRVAIERRKLKLAGAGND